MNAGCVWLTLVAGACWVADDVERPSMKVAPPVDAKKVCDAIWRYKTEAEQPVELHQQIKLLTAESLRRVYKREPKMARSGNGWETWTYQHGFEVHGIGGWADGVEYTLKDGRVTNARYYQRGCGADGKEYSW